MAIDGIRPHIVRAFSDETCETAAEDTRAAAVGCQPFVVLHGRIDCLAPNATARRHGRTALIRDVAASNGRRPRDITDGPRGQQWRVHTSERVVGAIRQGGLRHRERAVFRQPADQRTVAEDAIGVHQQGEGAGETGGVELQVRSHGTTLLHPPRAIQTPDCRRRFVRGVLGLGCIVVPEDSEHGPGEEPVGQRQSSRCERVGFRRPRPTQLGTVGNGGGTGDRGRHPGGVVHVL